MRLLVCGGRDYRNSQLLFATLDEINPDLVITGGATGADQLAQEWAVLRGKPFCVFPAHWGAKGKAAGPVRNLWMAEHAKADLLVAFPGGRGTADMIANAQVFNIPVRTIDEATTQP